MYEIKFKLLLEPLADINKNVAIWIALFIRRLYPLARGCAFSRFRQWAREGSPSSELVLVLSPQHTLSIIYSFVE